MSIDPSKWWPIAHRLPILFQDGAPRRHYSPGSEAWAKPAARSQPPSVSQAAQPANHNRNVNGEREQDYAGND